MILWISCCYVPILIENRFFFHKIYPIYNFSYFHPSKPPTFFLPQMYFLSIYCQKRPGLQETTTKQDKKTKKTVTQGKSPHSQVGQGSKPGGNEFQEQPKVSETLPLPVLGVPRNH